MIQSVAESIAAEIQRSLDFYAATSAESVFSKIYLSGGSGRIPALGRTIGHTHTIGTTARSITRTRTHLDPRSVEEGVPLVVREVKPVLEPRLEVTDHFLHTQS